MKKFLLFVFIIGICCFGFLFYKHYNDDTIAIVETMEKEAIISNFYVYGTTFNMSSSLDLSLYDDIDFVLYNGEFTSYDCLYNDGVITFSNYINDGFKLDNIKRGEYFAFIRVSTKNDDKTEYKYFRITNGSSDKELTYYTMSKKNNVVNINFDNDYKTLAFNVKKNNESEVYDITLDAGHGGMDGGAGSNGRYESELTLMVAQDVKSYLEEAGYKVKLTRDEGSLTSGEIMDDYGESGRAVIPNLVHSKYTFSIHFNSNNSSRVHGIEIYTALNINYDLASTLVDSITKDGSIISSSNKLYKIYDGVYSRAFSESDIENSKNKEISRGNTPYDITTYSNYYYMIRETGGRITGAYVDDRNHDFLEGNPYVNSNIGNETYLLELGYLSNEDDFNYIVNNTSVLSKTVADGIILGLSS